MVGIPFNQKAKDFKGMKCLGYKFLYENGPRNYESEKIYKTINAVRKAAIPYSYPPASIIKVYRNKGGIVGRYVGAVSNMNGKLQYRVIDDLETVGRYEMKPDGSLGKKITKQWTRPW